MREPNTTRTGRPFAEDVKLTVWEKARAIPDVDPGILREDAFGTVISWKDYGTTKDLGWEIDHIRPVSKGGNDELDNLQALQWHNNRLKGDHWPNWRDREAA